MTKNAIERVLYSETSTFSDLCKTGGLDRKRDLRFTNLTFVDFSNSDLRNFNFVGARLEGSRFGNALVDETTIFHEGQNLGGLDRFRQTEFLSEIRHFKTGNESEKFSAVQALLYRFPDYVGLGGIALDYLTQPGEEDQKRGIQLFRQLLGLKAAGHEEMEEIRRIFLEHLNKFSIGASHNLLLQAFLALREQGLCQAYRYRSDLIDAANLKKNSIECSIALPRCSWRFKGGAAPDFQFNSDARYT